METISRVEFDAGIEILYDTTDPSLKTFLLEEFTLNKDYREWIITNFKRLYDPFWRVQKKTPEGVLLPTIHDFGGDIITIDQVNYCRAFLSPQLFKINSYRYTECYELNFERNKDFFNVDLITLPITQKFLSLLKKVK